MDVRIAALAGRQFGSVARWQLLRLGLPKAAIDKRVFDGRLHIVHQGVYAVGHPYVSRDGRLMAAVLAFPLGAVLSHRTAAERWGLLRPTSTRPNVTSAERTLHGRPGIVLHRCRSLAPELRTEVDGIPVTTLPRTLLDLGGGRDLRQLRRAWEEAQRRRLLDVTAVAHLCDHSPGRRVKPLRALIAEATLAPDTREELEHRFADLLRDNPDLPKPLINAGVGAYVVDALWPDHKLIVELDSQTYHWHRREQDSERDAELLLHGYSVYRITWRALTRDPERVADRLRRLLRTAPSPTRAAHAGGA